MMRRISQFATRTQSSTLFAQRVPTCYQFIRPVSQVARPFSTSRFVYNGNTPQNNTETSHTQQGQQQTPTQSETPTENTTTKPKSKRLIKFLLYIGGALVVLKVLNYIIVATEENVFVMNNSATSLLKKLPLNALSRAWGWMYSTYVPEIARPAFYRLYAFLFDANVDECEKDLKEYESLQAFFTRKLKPGVRQIHEQDDIISPVDGRVMSCGTVHIQRTGDGEEVDVLIEQVKGLSYPLHHFLGYGMKDALSALEQATGDVEEYIDHAEGHETRKIHKVSVIDHFLEEGKDEKKLHYCVLYLAPGDYHRYHSPCDWKINERKHISGYLFPVMPLFVKTMQGLFALNERVVLHGNWKHGDFHYVLVGATNVGSMVLYFDNSLNTNLKREKKRIASKKQTVKKPATGDEKKEVETKKEETTEKRVEADGSYDKYLEMKARQYQKGGLSIEKGEDIGYFRMGSTVVMLFEHSDPKYKFGIKPGDRVHLGEPLSSEHRFSQ